MGLKNPGSKKPNQPQQGATSQGNPAAEGGKNPPVEQVPLDQLALSALGLSQPPKDALPQLMTNYFERVAPKIFIPGTSQAILRDFANIDVTSEKIAHTLQKNPYYEYQLFTLIDSIRKREDQPTAESAVILYGIQNTRNLILALQLRRMVSGAHAEWSKEGKLITKPTDYLKFALKMEEQFSGQKNAYSEIAYAAGYLFDLASLMAQELSEDKKKVVAFVDTQFNHALKTALIGLELSKELPDFGFKKYAFSTCLIHDIGKIVIAALEPTYMDLLEDFSKREMNRRVREHVEYKKFGVMHAWLGGLFAQNLNVFQPVVPAIYHHHHPYLLQHNKDLYQLASVVCLATNMARNFKKTESAEDPVIQKWKSEEVKNFQIKNTSLIAAANRIT